MENLLNQVKILDFTSLLPGPYATKMLADMGAEVLKIENPKSPRLEDIFPPSIDGKSVTYEVLNRSKKVVQMDLKNQEEVEKLRAKLPEFDVLIEQFRPGTMEKLGFSYEQVKEVNPNIVYCSITSFGQDSARPGHDINFLAKSGIASLTGHSPRLPAFQLGDIVGGSLHAVIGILAALFARERTGQGRYIDISMTHCLVPLGMLKAMYTLVGLDSPAIGTEILDGGSIYDFYRTADERYLSIGSIEPKFFRNLLQGLGLKYNGDNYLFDQGLKEKISTTIAQKSLDHWIKVFEDLDACVEPVMNMDEVVSSNHFLFGDLEIRNPIKFKK